MMNITNKALAVLTVVSAVAFYPAYAGGARQADCHYSEHRTNKAEGIGKYATPGVVGSVIGAAIGDFAGKGHRDQDAATLAGGMAGLFLGAKYQERVGSKKIYTTWSESCNANYGHAIPVR